VHETTILVVPYALTPHFMRPHTWVKARRFLLLVFQAVFSGKP